MKLNYRKLGKGFPLIIVHGLYGSSDNWVSVGKHLAESFEVYIIDQRNHGRSPHNESNTYTDMREDLLEFMNDQNLEKVILVGHSMGGKTAMFFTEKYPHKVSSLIVVDIAPKNYSQVSDYSVKTINHKHIVDTMMNLNLNLFTTREQIDLDLSKKITDKRVRQFLLKNLKRESDKSFSWKLNIKAIHQHLPQIMDGLEKENFTKGRGITGFPVLFIKGANSNYINEDDNLLIRTIFPYAEILEIPNSGHWVHAEQPELLIKTILYFILD